MTALLFSYLAAGIVVPSVLVILLRNPIYCTLSLLVMFAHIAGLYLLLNAEFIAAVQVIVYAGAILVLYLFVVMLLNIKREERFQRQLVPALVAGVFLLAEIALVFISAGGGARFSELTGDFPPGRIQELGSTAVIGQLLFSRYLVPFEVASLLLLVAMVGAIVLSKKVG